MTKKDVHEKIMRTAIDKANAAYFAHPDTPKQLNMLASGPFELGNPPEKVLSLKINEAYYRLPEARRAPRRFSNIMNAIAAEAVTDAIQEHRKEWVRLIFDMAREGKNYFGDTT